MIGGRQAPVDPMPPAVFSAGGSVDCDQARSRSAMRAQGTAMQKPNF